jgi:hypothetical protein
MANILSSNVTYVKVKHSRASNANNWYQFTIAFGNGTLTYPTGGVPLLQASLGCNNYLRSVVFVDPSNGDGFLYKWDQSTNTIRIYQSAAESATAGALVELVGGTATPAATTLVAEVVGW